MSSYKKEYIKIKKEEKNGYAKDIKLRKIMSSYKSANKKSKKLKITLDQTKKNIISKYNSLKLEKTDLEKKIAEIDLLEKDVKKLRGEKVIISNDWGVIENLRVKQNKEISTGEKICDLNRTFLFKEEIYEGIDDTSWCKKGTFVSVTFYGYDYNVFQIKEVKIWQSIGVVADCNKVASNYKVNILILDKENKLTKYIKEGIYISIKILSKANFKQFGLFHIKEGKF